MNIYESMRRLEQSILENRYSHRYVDSLIKEDILTLKEQIDETAQHVVQYINGTYYKSKNNRLDHLKDIDLKELILFILINVLPNTKPVTIQTIIGKIAPRLSYPYIFDGVITAAELITVMSKSNLYTLIPAKQSNEGSISLISNVILDDHVIDKIEQKMYLPPMICKPNLVRNNTKIGYLNLSESVLLGNNLGKYDTLSDEYLALDIINILSRTPLSLDLCIIEYKESYLPSTKNLTVKQESDREENFNIQAIQTEKLHLDYVNNYNNKYYLTWKYDNRGRIYSQGYHINLQGTPYKKAATILYNKLFIPVNRSNSLNSMTPYEYLLIDIANRFGKDKLIWKERIEWVENNIDTLDVIDAEDPFGAIASINALKQINKGEKTGRLIEFDATTSFLQVLAILSGCKKTAFQCNLTNSGERQDFYTNVMLEMNRLLPKELALGYDKKITRKIIKNVIMTTFYGSNSIPIKVLGEGTPEYYALYDAMSNLAPGAVEVIKVIRSCWNENTYFHKWTLPDEHTARVPVTKLIKKRIEIDEYDHKTFTYQCHVIETSKRSVSILANVVQSFDAAILRETVRLAYKENITILCIHDAYLVSPLHMDRVKDIYKSILINYSKKDLLFDFIEEIGAASAVKFTKFSPDLHLEIEKADYFLC